MYKLNSLKKRVRATWLRWATWYGNSKNQNVHTEWHTKVSHYQESSLNRIKNRQCSYISHQFWV